MRPKNRAELRLAVKAVRFWKNDAQQGLAHFMEHMNFNGTTHFLKNELVNFLQKTGYVSAPTSMHIPALMKPVVHAADPDGLGRIA